MITSWQAPQVSDQNSTPSSGVSAEAAMAVARLAATAVCWAWWMAMHSSQATVGLGVGAA